MEIPNSSHSYLTAFQIKILKAIFSELFEISSLSKNKYLISGKHI